jgi:hypothetical protein
LSENDAQTATNNPSERSARMAASSTGEEEEEEEKMNTAAIHSLTEVD